MTKRLKIVVSTPTFLPIVGGAELAIHEIYRRLASRHDVTVLTVQPRRRAVAMYGANDYLSRPYEVREALGQAEARAPDIVGRVLNHTSVPYIVELGRLRRERPIDVLNFHYLRPHGGALLCARYVWGIPGRSLIGWPNRCGLATASPKAPLFELCRFASRDRLAYQQVLLAWRTSQPTGPSHPVRR